jgi:hypothetical protein
VLVEAHDEWQVHTERRYLSQHSMALLAKKTTEEAAKPELLTTRSQQLTRTVSRNSTTQRDAAFGGALPGGVDHRVRSSAIGL